MLTMILFPLWKFKVPEEEIDPGPHPQIISKTHKLNYLPTLILSEMLVIFRTWINYIRNLIPWYHDKLKFTSDQVTSLSPRIFKYHYKKDSSFTKKIHLYHDHYMIDIFILKKKIYLYHHHFIIGILNMIHFKFTYPFNRKAVRFKILSNL